MFIFRLILIILVLASYYYWKKTKDKDLLLIFRYGLIMIFLVIWSIIDEYYLKTNFNPYLSIINDILQIIFFLIVIYKGSRLDNSML